MARKILLADDSVTAQNMGRKILADAGYEVVTVNNGSAALKKITEQKPDLIVLDVYMPGYSGLEVCQRLKESTDTARIPIVLTVGKLEPFKPEEAKRVRAEGFIVKPFEASELLSVLSKLEDKIVPRSDGKPGRFARTIAAIDDPGRSPRFDAADEDAGWKNRIGFPKKKKRKADEEEEPETVYSPPSELGTALDRMPHAAAKPEAGREDRPDEQRVDVAALGTPGLPKDVTAEELAAIAAAAAQVEEVLTSAKQDDTGKPESPQASEVPSAESATATFAEHTPIEQKIESASEMAAQPRPASGNGTPPWAEPENPITMAMPSQPAASPAPRWTAVGVALDEGEDATPLEQEMQRASSGHGGFQEPPTQARAVSDLNGGIAAAIPDTCPAAEEPVSAAPLPTVEPAAVMSETTALPEASSEDNAKISSAEPSNTEAPTEPEAQVAPSPGSDLPSFVPPQAAPEFAVTDSPVEMTDQEAGALPTSSDSAVSEISLSEASPSASETEQSWAQHHGSAASVETTPEPAAQPETAPAEANVPTSSAADHSPESDLAATTAAAWARWRQIRETSHPKADEPGFAADLSAMAVAAGSEHSPQDTPGQSSVESPEIASIVDSVLADLRPKIVEEISRKLGKK